ncbi:extracellular solute-binding protein [Leptothrix discophora]|uniref:Extracellular solute-binding protein n=1 Tax=Leptothrix discophora TaxID=89 RepID=A0ABT9G2Q2_LEPDI|nr:extracellular solute-binding protein [Leptothrix discophora]MDP4300453.1 extracellular solute-binding protein [Leptothrix discophora]
MTASSFPKLLLASITAALGLGLAAPAATAQEKVLNLYSARHYQTDEALYTNFTKATGIRINRVDTDDAALLQRLKTEGSASPADVVLLVDAARLWRAETDGLFSPVKSAVLEQRIPAQLRGKDNGEGSQWFGFSTRARVIVYNKADVKAENVDTYEKLADPVNKGRFCSRSGSHPYNLSLFGAYLEHLGEAKTEAWLKGIVANQARDPKGGDTDQIKAVATGECGVTLSNTYYVARLMRSSNPDDRKTMEQVGVIFPNQKTWGAHVNVAGGAVARHARNRDAAIRFLEYLSSDDAQRYFADGNNEYPAVAGVKTANPALTTLGAFNQELIPISVVGQNSAKVQQILDRVGFK